MSANREAPVDLARAILDDLVHQRQLMQRNPADTGLLEANRLAIIYWQRQLPRLLAAERQCAPQAATVTQE
jgi:hypothetical protein